MNKINKKGMSLAIVLLVIATLVLVSTALITFYVREKSYEDKIAAAGFLQDVYTKEAKINFYAYNVLENINSENKAKEDIIKEFRNELSKYKESDWEFILDRNGALQKYKESDWIFTIKEDDVKINPISIPLIINITKIVKDDKGNEIFSATYVYDKTFEKTTS